MTGKVFLIVMAVWHTYGSDAGGNKTPILLQEVYSIEACNEIAQEIRKVSKAIASCISTTGSKIP